MAQETEGLTINFSETFAWQLNAFLLATEFQSGVIVNNLQIQSARKCPRPYYHGFINVLRSTYNSLVSIACSLSYEIRDHNFEYLTFFIVHNKTKVLAKQIFCLFDYGKPHFFENLDIKLLTQTFEVHDLLTDQLFTEMKENLLRDSDNTYEMLLEVEVCHRNILREIYNVGKPKEKIHYLGDMGKFYKEHKKYDVRLKLKNGKEIPAHKDILTRRSVYFRKMLGDGEDENEFELEDIDDQTLQALLEYMYTGKLENIDTVAIDMIRVADNYEIAELKKLCMDYVLENLKLDNIVSTLIMVDIYKHKHLQEQIIDFIVGSGPQIMQTKEIEKLKRVHQEMYGLVMKKMEEKHSD